MGRETAPRMRAGALFAALVAATWGLSAGVVAAPTAGAAGHAPSHATGAPVRPPKHAAMDSAPLVTAAAGPAAGGSAAAAGTSVAAPDTSAAAAPGPSVVAPPGPSVAALPHPAATLPPSIGPGGATTTAETRPTAASHVSTVEPGGPGTASPLQASFTLDQPGRVEQLPGQAGYALTVPLGTTSTTTLTTPSLTCAAVPSIYRETETGVQLTMEVNGVYVYGQATCFDGEQTDYFAVSFTSRRQENVTPGVTATFTETVQATEVVVTLDIPAQRGAAAFDKTWDVSGSFTGGSEFLGILDEPYDGSAGNVPPYTQIPFNDTDVGGEGLGAFIEASPSSHAAEQNSVFGGVLRDQTSYIGGGSSFTIDNANLGLPYATMNNPTVLQPATGTTVVDVTVTLSEASTYPIYISYAVGGTVVRFDYTSGTLTFSPGVTTQEIPITVLPGEGGGDTTFDMYLLYPSYTTTQSKPAVVTIEAVDVNRVGPNSGLVQGGNQIVVTGDNFTGATAVVFTPLGGTPVDATDFTVDSSGQITVTVPDVSDQLLAGQSSMVVDIQVKVDRAESPRVPTDDYQAVLLAVTSVGPNTGPLAGGTGVTITGTGFTWATDVVFTLSDGQQFSIPVPSVGGGTLQVESPEVPGDAVKRNQAIANVQVVDDDQGVSATSADTGADKFTYQGPVVSSVHPSAGPLAGGTEITVTGSDFTDGTAVVFAFANGTKTTVKATPGSGSSVTVAVPAASASLLATDQAVANVEVRVTTDGSSATSPATGADQFTYKGPKVTWLGQMTGPLAGGTTLTVHGTWFTGATAVLFRFANASVLSVPATATSNTAITVKTPAVPATDLSTGNAVANVEVQVQGAGGTTAASPQTSADQFTFQGPTVASVSPSSGPAQGGTSITVSGHGFTGTTAVVFHFSNGTSVSVPASATADTSVTVTSPEITATELSNDQAVSDVEVEVAAADDTTATSLPTPSDHFTFQGPKVSKVSPASGPVQGGTVVKITGSNLSGASEVELVAPDATEYDALARTVTASSITVTTPALPATELTKNQVVLQVAVEVPLADGSIAISPSARGGTFTMKGPAVHKVSPASGLEGTTVTVAGSNLTGADRVTFTVGGVPYSATPTKVSATSLSVVSPNLPASAMASGTAKATVQVDVPLPNSTTAVSPTSKSDVFSYEAPKVTSVSPTTGPVAGGNKVTVKGKNLAKATAVTLTIGTTVLSVAPTATSSSSLTFTATAVPADLVGKSGAMATVQVEVPTPSDVTLVSATTSKDHYTYRAPAVTKLSPASGPSTGGTKVTATGTELTGANQVVITVGKTVLTVSPSAATATSVTFTTPAIPSSLLKQGKAVAAVQVGVPGAGGSESKSAIVKGSHFTYLGGG
jgi:hypothetical protein